jgi:hypothetical protein
MKPHWISLPIALFALTLCYSATAQTTVSQNNFGWQCGPSSATNCQNGLPTDLPYTLRLHDSGTYWSLIAPTAQSTASSPPCTNPQAPCNWAYLDFYLDALAATGQPHFVIQTFVNVPCWASSQNPCENSGVPSDLSPTGGSTFFNDFVAAFVAHCSANNNCVRNLIQGYELWNEWNLQTADGTGVYWDASALDLYEMVRPAAIYIKEYYAAKGLPTPTIIMPSTTAAASTYQNDLKTWLLLENHYTRISDWANWHLYMTCLPCSQYVSNTPEYQWENYGINLLATKNANGWSSVPWVDSETNFIGSGPGAFYCPDGYNANVVNEYSVADCGGQVARWQLLHDSNGSAGLYWYYGNTTIGNSNGPPPPPTGFEAGYSNLEQYLNGGTFPGPCSIYSTANNMQTWACNFTESGGTSAQFVWACTLATSGNETGYCGPTASTANASYPIPSGYTQYRTLTNSTWKNFTVGQTTVAVGAVPIEIQK